MSEDDQPPTPISKDTPLLSRGVDKRTSVPVLPALTFNDGFFIQNGPTGLPFLDEEPHSSPVVTGERAPIDNYDPPSDEGTPPMAEHEGAGNQRPRSFLRQKFKVLATMAAVAESPVREEAAARMGYPMIEYHTGDLFRVMLVDEEYIFGKSEHGELGWAERASFVPLA